jgi:hypothetical protein
LFEAFRTLIWRFQIRLQFDNTVGGCVKHARNRRGSQSEHDLRTENYVACDRPRRIAHVLFSAELELQPHGGERVAVEQICSQREDDSFFNSDVFLVDPMKLFCDREEARGRAGIQCCLSDPSCVELCRFVMQRAGFHVFRLKPFDVCEYRMRVELTKPREERIFFVSIVAWSGLTEVVQRGLGCSLFFILERAALRLTNHFEKNVEETFNPAMAIFQHANGVIESTIGFCAYLHSHG